MSRQRTIKMEKNIVATMKICCDRGKAKILKKHLTYVMTYRFFVTIKLRAELKRVCCDIQLPCHDTAKGILEEECHNIENIVTTQRDQSSLRVCCNISKLCRDNYQMVSAKVWCDIHILCRDTKKGTKQESLS